MAAGFDFGCPGDQVTVAKQRTMFQTQTLKCGEVDVSCKDYVFSWGARIARGKTSYTPDLHSDFGVQRGTEKTTRLPTTTWPFDHAGVAVIFEPGKRAGRLSAPDLQPLQLERPKLLWLKAALVSAVAIFAARPHVADDSANCW